MATPLNYTGEIVEIVEYQGERPNTWRRFIRANGIVAWENFDTGEQTEWADGREMTIDDIRAVVEGRLEDLED